MEAKKEYLAILNPLKTLQETGKVIIAFQENTCSSGEERPRVLLNKHECLIRIEIREDDSRDIIAESIIKAEELMDELERLIGYKKNNPELFGYLKANLNMFQNARF